MFWYKIIDWFSDMSERHRLIRTFNKAGNEAFVYGVAPTLLEASISRGDSAYKHVFSKLYSGFRIKALSGRALTKEELIEIGHAILENQELIRRLVALGWDTLEVQDIKGFYGVKWALKDFANIGIVIPQNL